MGRRLYVGNLSYNVTSDQLRTMFAEHGDVVEASAITDRVTGKSKGFGFVEMATDEGAQKAINALHDHPLDGRNMVVNEAREREAQPPRRDRGGFRGGNGGGGGGGRDRDRDR